VTASPRSALQAPPAWWQWPTILSLDAPIVCLVWQALLARVLGAGPSWPHAVVLGASVWLAYAADRWLEGWRVHRRALRTQRHHFYQRHRWTVLVAWIAVLAADIVVAVTMIGRTDLARGLLLLGPVAAYLLSHQLVHRHRRWRAPKEAIVALLLTAGVALFLVALPSASPSTLLVSCAAFGLTCFINCALISSWEREVDRAQGQTSLALQSTRNPRLIKRLPWAAAGMGLVSLTVVSRPEGVVVACAAGSALLLVLVDALEPRMGRAAARVLADVALMTPLVPFVWRG
jgi:hypothetical protein